MKLLRNIKAFWYEFYQGFVFYRYPLCCVLNYCYLIWNDKLPAKEYYTKKYGKNIDWIVLPELEYVPCKKHYNGVAFLPIYNTVQYLEDSIINGIVMEQRVAKNNEEKWIVFLIKKSQLRKTKRNRNERFSWK